MRAKASLGIAVALALVTGSHCGRQATRVSSFGLEPKYATVPAAMGPLIPADAVGLLYLESIDAAERSLHEVSSKTADDSSRIDIAGMISQRLGIPPESIDRTRPAAVALSLLKLGRPIPVPTVILPVRNEQEVLEELRSRSGTSEPLGNKGYVGVALMPGYELGTGIPPLAKNLPAGSIAVRLRMDRILVAVQPFIDMALEKMMDVAAEKGRDAEEGAAQLEAVQARTARALAQQALDLLRATETLDVGARTRDGNLALAYRMQTTAESRNVAATAERAAGLVDLSRCLPEDYPVMGLVAMDFMKLVDIYKSMYSGVLNESMAEIPEPMREYTQSMMEHSLELYRLAEDQMFYAMRFTDSGAEVVHVLTTQDPSRFVEEIQKIMGFDLFESMGLGSVEREEPVEIDGVRIEGVRVRVDLGQIVKLHGATRDVEPGEESSPEEAVRVLRTFLGGDVMVVRFAAVGDRVVVVTHPDRTIIEGCIAALKKRGGRLPTSLRMAQGFAKEPVCFWTQADLRELLMPVVRSVHADTTDAETRELLREMEAMEPMPVVAYTTAGNQAYQGAIRLNVRTFQKFAELLGRRAGHHRTHAEEMEHSER